MTDEDNWEPCELHRAAYANPAADPIENTERQDIADAKATVKAHHGRKVTPEQ